MMPKLSGIDLLAQIRTVDDDIAVIILTGYPSLETATASIQHDVSAYIHKPFTPTSSATSSRASRRRRASSCAARTSCTRRSAATSASCARTRGLTLKQMARRTNLSVSLLSQIERAESSASVSSLFKVATALDVRITELFGDF